MDRDQRSTLPYREEIRRVYYESLRNEILERVRLREQVLFAYLGFSAALISYAIAPPQSVTPASATSLWEALMIIIPFLGFAASNSIARHLELISSFNVYLSRDEWLDIPVWDYYSAGSGHTRKSAFTLAISQACVLVGPSIAVIFFNSKHLFVDARSIVLFVIALALIAATTLRLWRAMKARIESGDVIQGHYKDRGTFTATP